MYFGRFLRARSKAYSETGWTSESTGQGTSTANPPSPLLPLSLLSPFAIITTLDRLVRKSRPAVRAEVLPRVKCIVVDEVDRLVDVLSKHAPPKEVEKRKRHARPIAALLERVLQSSPDAQV